MPNYFENWSFAWGKPTVSGVLRSTLEGFQVTEQLKHKPTADGEHAYVFVEKRGENTDWVAGQIAALCDVAKKDIGYAGMKDRRAVTRQWFSVYLAAKPEPDWQALNSENLQVLITTRNQKKLRRGALSGNQFEITVTDLQGELKELGDRLEQVKTHGVPNYFGEQRFGNNGGNVASAKSMFAGRTKIKRHKRSIYLSAARSYLFNEVLNQRIQDGSWVKVYYGDVLMLSGSNSIFFAEKDQLTQLQHRFEHNDVDITGPLAGEGDSLTVGGIADVEQEIFDKNPELVQGLQEAGMDQERRRLRVIPQDMQWEMPRQSLKLKFFLPAGSYATSVLRELINYTVAHTSSEE